MVIQRSWKTQNEAGTNSNILQMSATSSSEDSNGSNQTTNSVATSNTNNSSTKVDIIKYVTTPQMAENILGRLKQRFGNHTSGRKSSSDAAMRSLELLRITIQIAFDKEVDTIVKKFIEVYFKPAIKNIKENLGDHIVTEEMLQKMMCALLENSKAQYNLHRSKPPSVAMPAPSIPNISHSDQVNLKPEISTQTSFAMKRPAPKLLTTEPNASAQISKKPALSTSQQQPQPQPQQQQQQQQQTISTPVLQHQQQQQRPNGLPARRQIFWNTAAISTETNFVLDVQANQAFGFGTDGKERLASKHPELIRYLPDGQDRDWLVERKIIPSQNRNSRFLFLIYDEVKKLAETDLYKDRENVNLSILHIFKIPSFIIQKMKLFFIDLNIKSRGLITNSYSAIANSNHLRNALLQGSSQGVPPSTNVSVASTSVNSVSTSTDTVASPPKLKSSLSSSHATLTALLTNNTGSSGSSKIAAVNDKRTSDNVQSSSISDANSFRTENVPKKDVLNS